MKGFIVSLAVLSVVGLVIAQDQPGAFLQQPKTVREKNNNDGSGNYLFTYELDNQQIFSEASELRTYENNQQAIYKSGAYSFVGSDGQTYWVTYYADDKGFHPTIGVGAGGIGGGQDASIDPNALKSLIG